MLLVTKILLSLFTGIVFGISFPPNKFGIISVVAFVPIFYLLEYIKGFRSKLFFIYITFLISTLIALYWVGGFTHGKDIFLMIAAIALYLWQPFVYVIPFLIYLLFKKYFNISTALFLFPFIWIICEWLYSFSEFAFPWMMLSNTLTYENNLIQFIELTGSFGLSFWIILLNVLIFYLLYNYKSFTFKYKLINALIIFLIFISPKFYKSSFNEVRDTKIKIAISQPNIDPWSKWNKIDNSEVTKLFPEISISDSIDLIILPETAILSDIFNDPLLKFHLLNKLRDLNTNLLTGFINTDFVKLSDATVTSNYYSSINKYVDNYNSIAFLNPNSSKELIYNKSRLVPFAERIPFAEQFSFLIKPLQWSIGLSSWGKGNKKTIFEINKNKFAALICFESIFPNYVSDFVKNGASFIIFVTNDSWYDNSNGPIQHNQFAILRAIENRRWIARCANGGISSFISPNGEIISQTKMFEKTKLIANIYPQDYKTFYSLNGDWFVYLSMLIFFITAIILIFRKMFYD